MKGKLKKNGGTEGEGIQNVTKDITPGDNSASESSSMNSDDVDAPENYFHPPLMSMLSADNSLDDIDAFEIHSDEDQMNEDEDAVLGQVDADR